MWCITCTTHTYLTNRTHWRIWKQWMVGKYVQVVVASLNEQFPNLPIFNVSKLFIPKHYLYDDDDDWDRVTTYYLNMLMAKLTIIEVNNVLCTYDWIAWILKDFSHECENEGLFESWSFCGHNNHWHTNWPFLLNEGQKVCVIPTSTWVVCEWGSSKQNIVKNHLWLNFKIRHIGCFYLLAIAWNWITIFDI